MMRILACEQVREDLTAYHDGELPLDHQVRVQSHLQECIACRLELAAIAELSNALRTMAGAVPGRSAGEAGRITAGVLERIRVERQLSLGSRVRDLFQDMHLVWAGLGATVAVVICFYASAGVLQAASQEKPESLAGIITTLANQGTNDYPLRLGGAMLAPRAMMDAPMPTAVEDGEFALSAVVTREGRIQNLEVLGTEQETVLQLRPEAVGAMLDLAARARFEPALSGGLPVAVNVVWLVTSTTVKGRPDYDRYLVNPPRFPDPINGPAPSVKRVPTPTKVPTAGSDDGVTAA